MCENIKHLIIIVQGQAIVSYTSSEGHHTSGPAGQNHEYSWSQYREPQEWIRVVRCPISRAPLNGDYTHKLTCITKCGLYAHFSYQVRAYPFPGCRLGRSSIVSIRYPMYARSTPDPLTIVISCLFTPPKFILGLLPILSKSFWASYPCIKKSLRDSNSILEIVTGL